MTTRVYDAIIIGAGSVGLPAAFFLAQAGLEPDYDLSLELYRQAEQVLVEDAACLPLWFGKNYILVKSYVEGYELGPQGLADLSSVSLEGD